MPSPFCHRSTMSEQSAYWPSGLSRELSRFFVELEIQNESRHYWRWHRGVGDSSPASLAVSGRSGSCPGKGEWPSKASDGKQQWCPALRAILQARIDQSSLGSAGNSTN